MANPGRRVALWTEFHADLEFWLWFVDKGLDARCGVFSATMYHLLECPAQRHNVRCSRTRKIPPSGDIVSKPVFTGAMI